MWATSAPATKPLPAIVQRATALIGEDRYVVFPQVQKKMVQRMQQYGLPGTCIQSLLEETDIVIGGSFLLRHLMHGAGWKPGDLDLFGSEGDVEAAKHWLWEPDVVKTDMYSNQIAKIYEWSSKGMACKIQLIALKDTVDVEEYVSRFDLDIVRSFYDGRFIRVPKDTHKALISKTATAASLSLDDRQRNLRVEADARMDRMFKYVQRGFDVQMPQTFALLPREYSDHGVTFSPLSKRHPLKYYYKWKKDKLVLRKGKGLLTSRSSYETSAARLTRLLTCTWSTCTAEPCCLTT